MSLPASLTTAILTADFRTLLGGSALDAEVVISSPSALVSPSDNVIVPRANIQKSTVAGILNVTLPVADDAEWGPQGFQYMVRATFNNGIKQAWLIKLLTAQGPTQDLADYGVEIPWSTSTAAFNVMYPAAPALGGSAYNKGSDPPARTIFPAPRRNIIQTFQSGHGWTLNGLTGATFVDDTTDYVLGTQSLKLITGGAGLTHEIRSPTLTALDLTTHQISITFKLDDYTHYSDIQLRFSSDGFVNYGYWKPAYTSLTQRWSEGGVWTTVTLNRGKVVGGSSWNNAALTYVGLEANVNWAAITGVRIKVVDDAVAPITFRVNRISYFPKPAKAVLSLVFDDGRRSQFTLAKPILDKVGLNATAAIIVDSIDSAGTAYMTSAMVKQLKQHSNWSICVHAYNNIIGTLAHLNGYDGITAVDGENDIQQVRAWMNDNGYDGPNIICLPHGSWSINTPATVGANTDVLGLIAKYFDASRTTNSNLLETYPPADPIKLRAYTASKDDTAAQWLAVLDEAIAGSSWAIIQFHHFVATPVSNTEVDPAVFQTFITGVMTRVAAGSLIVRSLHEVLQNGVV